MSAPRSGPAEPLPLAGLLPVDEGRLALWPWSGAWIWPVGGDLDCTRPPADGAPAWRLLRGFSPAAGGRRPHEGMDLGNGRAGDTVRAAAHGLVVAVCDRRDASGYGRHVVLAHRLREGGLAYGVYAHLQPGSLAVEEGQRVWAGRALGAVGRSGRASADHLHFEVRLAGDPGERWERARAVDPAAFVERRLPRHAADTSRTGAYLDWADRAGLIEAGADPDGELGHGDWQLMLARAACLPLLSLPCDAGALAGLLADRGLLAGAGAARAGAHPGWGELGRDLARLGASATRLPPPPLDAGAHREACLARFRLAEPSADSTALRGRRDPPTLADACLLLADLAARAAVPPAAAGAR